MQSIDLKPYNCWRWIEAIAVGTIDAEKDSELPQRPLLDVTADCSPFTGEYILQINKGGLQNRNISKQGKELFRAEVP